MSDVMLFGVLKMPYEMAMADELSRRQFYARAQEAVKRLEAAPPVAGEPVAVPEGFALVPIKPTPEMHAAAVRTIVRCTGNADWPPRVWRAMLAVAPEVVAPAPQPDRLQWLKEAALQINRLYLAAIAKGSQSYENVAADDCITDADIDAIESKLLAHLAAAPHPASKGEGVQSDDGALGENSGSVLSDPPSPSESSMTRVGWMDERGNFHHSEGRSFIGLVSDDCSRDETHWEGRSLQEAAEQWRRLTAQSSRQVDLTGLGMGVIARHAELKRQFGETKGTFACPLCGKEMPHEHSGKEIHEHREFEAWVHERHEEEWAAVVARINALEAKNPSRKPVYVASSTTAGAKKPNCPESSAGVREALSGEEIDAIAKAQDDDPAEPWFTRQLTRLEWRYFARDIEKAHGIKQGATP